MKRYWFEEEAKTKPGWANVRRKTDSSASSPVEVTNAALSDPLIDPVSGGEIPGQCDSVKDKDDSVKADTAAAGQEKKSGLKVYYGNKIESLAEKLVAELADERKVKGPFEFLKVAVANPNLGNWLKMKVLAKVPALSAGVEMPFLTEELERILRANCGTDVEIVSGREYPHLILNILMKDGRQEFAPFCKYIKEQHYRPGPLTIVSQREARRGVQLANRLGGLIDDYEATDYLSLLEDFKDKSEIYRGEWALVEAMKGVPSIRKVFDSVKERPPQGPTEKIVLFGHTTLTAIQREMLEWVAKTHDVVWYHPGSSMVPQKGVNVRVVGVPGLRREVEMVHESILKAVWDRNEDGKPVKKDGISFSDIAVLVADMPKYRAMVESVFEGRGQIPYGLIDATTQNYCTYLDGFLALMDIARYGMDRERLFAALDNPCVQRSMDFTREDVNEWRKLASRVGAYEGYEVADSDEGNVSGRFNWAWALRRLRLGLVTESLDGNPLESLDGDQVAKFSEVVETLHRRLSSLNGMKALCASADEKVWPNTWAGRLHAVMDEFLAVEADDVLGSRVRADIVRTLNSLHVIEGEQTYRLPLAVVENAVAGVECAKGGYLRHGVTIGGLRSLAFVPFKKIFVLGLAEGTMPGRNDRSTLDVRNEVEERQDVLRTDENRARFAAAVASAREELILSYPCLDLQTEAKLYPSSLVHEVGGDRMPESYPLADPGSPVPESSPEVLNVSAPETMSIEAPSAKDLAAFVKDPYNGVFNRRFKIAKEAYRRADISEATPLGVPPGSSQWDLENAMIFGKLSSAFDRAKDLAQVPSSYLGDFAKTKLSKLQSWADTNVSEADRKVLSGEVEARECEIICRHFNPGSEDDPITIPPSAVLEPFYENLMKYLMSASVDAFRHRIKVIAFGTAVCTWEWNVERTVAETHLANVTAWFGKVPPSVSYDGLRKVLRRSANAAVDDAGWSSYADALTQKEGGLVIDRTLDQWRTCPDGRSLKKVYQEIFELPMSGMIVGEEGGLAHE